MKNAKSFIFKNLTDSQMDDIPVSVLSNMLLAMEEYASQFQQSQWIKIESEEDLPKDRVLCWFNDKKDGVIDGGVASYNRQFILENATHYMPIIKPEPPKED